jgi:hypothetical protein
LSRLWLKGCGECSQTAHQLVKEIKMALKSRTLILNKRLKEAGNLPFHSITSRDSGNPAIKELKNALKLIAEQSPFLPTRLLPRPFGPNGPPGVAWGPFFGKGTEFDEIAAFMVQTFQRQAGNLKVDGKPGVKTLHRLDEILLHIESLPPRDLPVPPGS